jgi:hypothetical protein
VEIRGIHIGKARKVIMNRGFFRAVIGNRYVSFGLLLLPGGLLIALLAWLWKVLRQAQVDE